MAKVKTDITIREWVADIKKRKEDITQVYYDGWITDVFLDARLDELNRELASATRRLETGNQNPILDSDFMTEFPF